MILVTLDTLRADHVGCYGSERARTPTLDALAAGGVRFDAAISPAPLTLPSHASLMTALDPPEHGVRHNSIFRLGAGIPTLAERMADAGYATAAFVGALVLDRQFGLARGFQHYDDQMGARRSSLTVGYAERRADAVVDSALAWLEQAPPRFFVWLHFYDPHFAYEPPPGFALAFAGHPYDGEIAFTDSQLGRFLDAVRARHGDGGTLIVATSDHGESLGEHGEDTHSYSIYEATQRVPLLLQGPGFAAGRVVSGPARLVDIAPTLLAAVGAAPLGTASGRPLGPLIHGHERSPRLAYLETLATQLDLGWSPLLGIRSERWKYLRAPRPELYDLLADPGELDDRSAQEPAVVAQLDAELEARLAHARPVEARLELADADRARLESLGYVVAAPPAGAELGRVGGLDPKDEMESLRALHAAEQDIAQGRPAEALARLAPLGDRGFLPPKLRAAAWIAAGSGSEAERAVRVTLAARPDQADALSLLGQALELQGKLAGARESYESAARLDPASADPRLGLGRVAELGGKRDEAAARYREALEARAAGLEPRWRLAALRLEDGEAAEAEALLAEVPAATQAEPRAALRLAAAERAAGRREAARARIEASLAAHPGIAALLSAKGTLLEEEGRTEQALAAREAALALQPEHPALQNDVAWTLALLRRDLARALELARAAVQGSGGAAAALDTLATVELRRGDAGAALASAERALAGEGGGPARAHLLYVRAAALAGLGRREEARRSLAQAMELAAMPSAAPAGWREEAVALARRLGLPPPEPFTPAS